MRKVILGLAVTLDGFIEGPNGEYDWCFSDQDYGMNDFFKRIDALFIGRKSYEMMQGQDAGSGGFPKMTEYVFSNTLKNVKKDAVLINGDIRTNVNEIKNSPGKDIWMFGGASLTRSLLNGGMIDELWLSVHPILLGKGKPLFSEMDERVPLELIASKSYDTGLVSLKYSFAKK